MDKLCKIRDLQRAVHQFESAFEKRYGICLNEGMTLCSLSKTGRLCPGELGEGNGDGLAAGTFQHGFLAVQPDEFCFQFFPLEVGPGAPLCKGGKEKGEQSSRRQAEACGLFHQG